MHWHDRATSGFGGPKYAAQQANLRTLLCRTSNHLEVREKQSLSPCGHQLCLAFCQFGLRLRGYAVCLCSLRLQLLLAAPCSHQVGLHPSSRCLQLRDLLCLPWVATGCRLRGLTSSEHNVFKEWEPTQAAVHPVPAGRPASRPHQLLPTQKGSSPSLLLHTPCILLYSSTISPYTGIYQLCYR